MSRFERDRNHKVIANQKNAKYFCDAYVLNEIILNEIFIPNIPPLCKNYINDEIIEQ